MHGAPDMKKEPDNPTQRHVVIIGAGLSGLALSWRLHKAGMRVTVLESSDRVGGVIRSERVDGFLCEWGPNSMLVKSKTAEAFVDEIGLTPSIVEANPAADKRYLVKRGRPVALPMSAMQAIGTPLYSLGAKFRLLAEPFIRVSGLEDESVASYVSRRMGHEFLDYGIDPLVSGIWAGDPDRLSIRHAFPKVWNLEASYGSMIGGAIKLSRENKKNGVERYKSRLIAFRDGIEMLPRTLATDAAEIVTSARITGISRNDDGWQVGWDVDGETQQVACDALVISTPAFNVPSLPWDQSLADSIGKLPEVYHPPVTTLVMGYPRERVGHPLDGFGMLIPHAEKRRSLGAIFSTTCFPGRAPDGHVSLMVFLGGATMPDCASEDLGESVGLATAELSDLLGLEGDPVFAKQAYWPLAIPQYNVGYGDFLSQLTGVETNNPGLYFCANYRGGPGLSDVLDSTLAMSQRIVDSSD